MSCSAETDITSYLLSGSVHNRSVGCNQRSQQERKICAAILREQISHAIWPDAVVSLLHLTHDVRWPGCPTVTHATDCWEGVPSRGGQPRHAGSHLDSQGTQVQPG